MAHHINFNEQTGQHSFFSVKQKAWHGLGQIVEDYPTSKEALQFAGLDFNVVKMPKYPPPAGRHGNRFQKFIFYLPYR